MDGIDSNCMKKQNQEGLGFSADRISELPDDVILAVLSFLSLRDAASTSVLSPRWLDLWKHTPNLNLFDTNNLIQEKSETEHASWDSNACKHVKMVNSALELHQALSLKQFKISFYINKSAQSVITKWLKFVWSRQVKILKLNFRCNSRKHAVVLQDSMGEMRPMKYLEKLSLIMMKVSGEAISLFLRNCPFLRKLSITSSIVTSDVHISGATLALEHLLITGCRCWVSVNISAPNLSTVCVDARLEKLRFENVPKLVVARFGIIIVQSPRYIMPYFASALSCFTSQLQKLTLSLISCIDDDDHDVLIWQKLLGKGFPQLPNVKELVVFRSSLLQLTHVISACPRLQNFIFKFRGEAKDATTHSKRIKLLKFEGSSANIIQSVTYISESCAFQKIKTLTMSEVDMKGLCRQVQLQFQVQLRVQVIEGFIRYL